MAETYINAQDLVEDVSLDGEEQFVMFDTEAGRRAKLKNIKAYINDQEYTKQASTAGEAVVATQLLDDNFKKDTDLYTCRRTADSKSVDKAEIIDKITGGTVAWNQLVQNGDFTSASNWEHYSNRGTLEISNGIAKVTPTASNEQLYQPANLIAGHIYLPLVRIRSEIDNYKLYVVVGGMSSTLYTRTSWAEYGAVIKTITINTANNYFYLQQPSVDNMGYWEVDCFNCFDLTKMFGSTIANYIYSLEQRQAGAGVAFFKKLFNNDYYPHDSGTLRSVEGLSAHRTNGFNQWDEEKENGYIYNGKYFDNTSYWRTKNFVPVLPNTQYYISNMSTDGQICHFDANKTYTSSTPLNNTFLFTTPSNGAYIKFYNPSSTRSAEHCLNISSDRNGEYEPSNHRSYALDSSLALRGIPKIVDGKLIYDGDEYYPDGKVYRKYGIVDLGTLNWEYVGSTNKYFQSNGIKDLINAPTTNSAVANILCPLYETVAWSNPDYVNMRMAISGKNNNTIGRLSCINTAYTDIASFKSAMSGVYLVYELATPTTESAKPYTSVQACSTEGIEEFVYLNGNVNIPVMAETRYPVDPAKKMAVSDGHYDDMMVGTAKQLIGSAYTSESTPYLYRPTGGSEYVGDRENVNAIVGGTVAWNQLQSTINNYSVVTGDATPLTVSVSNGYISISGTPAVSTGIDVSPGWFNVPANHVCLIMADGTGNLRWQRVGGLGSMIIGAGGSFSKHTASFAAHARINLLANNTYEGSLRFNTFDLTQLFGSTIADYIYSLEQANAGAGVAWFKKLFPNMDAEYSYLEDPSDESTEVTKKLRDYQSGVLLSVEGVSAHEMVGFNQWDEEWEVGGINNVTGETYSANDRIRSKNFCRCLPLTNYFGKWGSQVSGSNLYAWFYDENQNFISGVGIGNVIFATPSNARYFKITTYGSSYTAYKNDICINLSGDRNGEYEPYEKHSYPLDDSLTLRGILKLDSQNNLYYDGDTYEADGTVTRKYGIVDLGTLTWTKMGAYHEGEYKFQANLTGIKPNSAANHVEPVMCSKYIALRPNDTYLGSTGISVETSVYGYIGIHDPNYDSSTAEQLKTAMNGVYLVYELATPTTEEATPYNEVQICNDFGTEEFVSTGIVPVGHQTKYYDNLTERIIRLPSTIAPVERSVTSSANYAVGDYLILNNTLYKVTSAIAAGGKITVGTNVTATTIMAEIKALI